MNLESLEIRPSVQSIYSLLGQERVMAFYFSDEIRLGKKYVNPFRKDTNASCTFRWSQSGNLYFVDYATEKVYYTPIDVACMRTGYEYPDILYKIESDFQLTSLNLEDKERLKMETKLSVVPEVKPANIKVKLTKFNKKDLEYWGNFGISESMLKFYDIRKVEKAWIGDDIWYLNNEFDPCYRYKEKEKFKIYRPFADKRNKFRSSYFGGILEGYTQLPHKGETLVITKGLKDVMTLSSLGINAVAVRSENTPLSENAYEILQSRFNKLYLWFDADEAGKIGCTKMMDKYGIPCLFHEEKWGKDPSDIYKNYGKEKLIEICKQLEILS
jgi:hypothetical protein